MTLQCAGGAAAAGARAPAAGPSESEFQVVISLHQATQAPASHHWGGGTIDPSSVSLSESASRTLGHLGGFPLQRLGYFYGVSISSVPNAILQRNFTR